MTDHKQDKGEVVAGQWLHGVRCERCGAAVPLFHDPSEGARPFSGTDPIDVECPNCGHAEPYYPDEFTSMRAVKS